MNEDDKKLITEFLLEVASTGWVGEQGMVHTPTLEYLIGKFDKLVERLNQSRSSNYHDVKEFYQ